MAVQHDVKPGGSHPVDHLHLSDRDEPRELYAARLVAAANRRLRRRSRWQRLIAWLIG